MEFEGIDKHGRRYRIPVLTDSLVNRLADKSSALLERAIDGITRDPIADYADPEDWFVRPYRVCEKLSDRLGVAEYCIRKQLKWKEYRGLLKQMELDY